MALFAAAYLTRLAASLPLRPPSRATKTTATAVTSCLCARGRREFLALFTSRRSSFLSSFVSDPDSLSLLPPSLIILARRCSGIEATLFEKASRVVSTYKNMRIYRKSPPSLSCVHAYSSLERSLSSLPTRRSSTFSLRFLHVFAAARRSLYGRP